MKMKKIIALMLVGILSASTLVGCGNKKEKVANTETDIEIAYWNSGLGTDWLDAVIAGFEEKHPEYNVEYTATASATAVTTDYGLEDIDTTDLYLAIKRTDSTYMESLEDLLNSTPEGETKTLREKINPNYLVYEEFEDGNVCSLSYGGGIIGFVYNQKLFAEAGITQLPRTTDELAIVCDTLYKKGITPICHFKDGGYYEFLSEALFAQYNGVDYYLNTFYGCAEGVSLELFTGKDGRYETLKAYEKFITPEYVMTGSNTNDHTYVQTEFINGKAAMIVDGSWMANEMKTIGVSDEFSTMRTPVISSIIDNLETVKKESELRKVIDAVDSVTDGQKSIEDYKQGDNYVVDGLTVSVADWDAIKSARNTMASNYSGDSAYIPKYSNAKEGAKEFLKYLYSDEGQKIYTDTLHISLPIVQEALNLDISEWSNFEQSQYELLKTSEQLVSHYSANKHAIFTSGGAASFANRQYVAKLCTKNEADRQSADELWDSIVKYIEDQYENTWLANIQ